MQTLVRILVGLLLLAAVLVTGLAAFIFVLAQAQGEYAFDVVGDAGLAALAWWAAAALVVGAGLGARRPGRHRVPLVLAAGLAVAAAVVGSLWLVRPQADDGRDRSETAAAGQARVVALVDGVAGGRGETRPPSSEGCRDRFGRTSGATRRSARARVVDGLDQAELEAAAGTLRADGWAVGPAPGSGTPGLSAARDGYRIEVETHHGDGDGATWTIVMATSPCLRA